MLLVSTLTDTKSGHLNLNSLTLISISTQTSDYCLLELDENLLRHYPSSASRDGNLRSNGRNYLFFPRSGRQPCVTLHLRGPFFHRLLGKQILYPLRNFLSNFSCLVLRLCLHIGARELDELQSEAQVRADDASALLHILDSLEGFKLFRCNDIGADDGRTTRYTLLAVDLRGREADGKKGRSQTIVYPVIDPNSPILYCSRSPPTHL